MTNYTVLISVASQLFKAPKLHFFDSGLLCYLPGIREPGQLRLYPLRSAIFESWIVSEINKARVHQGSEASLFHYRESRGLEIDCLIDRGAQLDAIEIKSEETFSTDYLKNLRRFSERVSGHDRIRKLRSYEFTLQKKTANQQRVQVIVDEARHQHLVLEGVVQIAGPVTLAFLDVRQLAGFNDIDQRLPIDRFANGKHRRLLVGVLDRFPAA